MTHPEFLQAVLRAHEQDVHRQARAAVLRRRDDVGTTASADPIVLRLCRVQDDASLERLAALEGHPAPVGRYVVAEMDGAVVAALPLGGGPPLADPFRSTAPVLPLLELRAKQLAGVRPRRAPFGSWVAARNWRRT